MKIRIDVEMQEYFNFNIGQFKKILESKDSLLIDKFKVESKIEAFKHAQNKLTHLQYEVSKELELARSAPETTEILNEVKADKGILSEEELTLNEKALNNSFRAKAMYETDHNLIEDIIASHRFLAERCRLLVIENEALNSENYILREGESP